MFLLLIFGDSMWGLSIVLIASWCNVFARVSDIEGYFCRSIHSSINDYSLNKTFKLLGGRIVNFMVVKLKKARYCGSCGLKA